MAKKAEKRDAEFKAGIFIIISISLLIFSILWLRYFSIRPEMTVIAKFSNPGPITRGLQSFYKGVNIGKISKIEFSKDFKHTLVSIDIYTKGLVLPENISAQIRSTGITGQNYIDLSYPQKPVLAKLSDGDIIYGKSPFGLDDIQDFFEKQIKSGRIERMLVSVENTLNTTNQMSARLNKMSASAEQTLNQNRGAINNFFVSGSQAATNISKIASNIEAFVHNKAIDNQVSDILANSANISRNLNDIIGDEGFKSDIKSSAANINKSTAGINRVLGNFNSPSGNSTALIGNIGGLVSTIDNFVSNLNGYTGNIYQKVNNSNIIENTNDTIIRAGITLDKANEVFGNTDKVLNKINSADVDGTTLSMIRRTLDTTSDAAKQVEETATSIDCLSKGVSKMLSKRFLLINLLFGKPGASLSNCNKPNCSGCQKMQPCPILKPVISK